MKRLSHRFCYYYKTGRPSTYEIFRLAEPAVLFRELNLVFALSHIWQYIVWKDTDEKALSLARKEYRERE